MSRDILYSAFEYAGIEKLLTPEYEEKLLVLKELLCEYNTRVNLTAIVDTEGVYVKHFADCAAAVPLIPEGASMVDVGAGGGFPSLPIAVLRPDVKVLSLDSTAKKLGFIDYAAKSLDLSNISTVAVRAEEFGLSKGREAFDVATARAVASLPVLLEICLPLVKMGGMFIALKATEEEIKDAENAALLLGGRLESVHHIELKCGNEQMQRVLIVYRKVKSTPPHYPRKYAKIKDRPL